MNERVAIGGDTRDAGKTAMDWILEAWNDHGHDDPTRRDEMMKLWVRSEVLRLNNLRAEEIRTTGTVPANALQARIIG